jgi:hypothetical protein
LKYAPSGRVPFQIFTGINRRLYNPEIAFGDFSDIKGDLSVAKSLRSTVANGVIVQEQLQELVQ